MLFLKNHNGYRHVLGTKISAISKFKFDSNMFMGLKINAFRFIKEKAHFLAAILDFGGRHLGILRGQRAFFKRVGFEEYMYQISCWYHHLNDSCYFLHLSAPLKVFRASADPLPASVSRGQARNTGLRVRAETIARAHTLFSFSLAAAYTPHGCWISAREAISYAREVNTWARGVLQFARIMCLRARS